MSTFARRHSAQHHTCTCGRFAPSPTGRIHLGNIYSMLIAWLSARSQQGRVVMRIEDLDPRAANKQWTTMLRDDTQKLGLYWDGDVVYQHDRIELYQEALSCLEESDLIYPCFCTRADLHAASAPHASDGTPLYAGTCRDLTTEQIAHRMRTRKPAMRLKVPNKEIQFEDRNFGTITENLADECGDFVVQRSDQIYAYQLVVVIDDALMGVNEVVRGSDLLGSCARQIYLQDLLGFDHPSYAHIPLLIAPDGHRLSKRNQDCSIDELLRIFGSAEALLGKLAYATGLAPTDEPTTAEKLVEIFDWDLVRAMPRSIVIDDTFFS